MPDAREARTDEALMTALSQGCEEALNELYQRYQRPLFGFAYRYMGDSELAMDTVQETFLRVYKNRSDYRPTAKFSSYIFRILRNLCVDEKRRYWNRKVRTDTEFVKDGEDDYGFVDSIATTERTSADVAVETEIEDRIRVAIESLSPEQREVLVLSKYEGLSYKEIADVLRIGTESVKQRAYRGHQKLRQMLKDLIDEL